MKHNPTFRTFAAGALTASLALAGCGAAASTNNGATIDTYTGSDASADSFAPGDTAAVDTLTGDAVAPDANQTDSTAGDASDSVDAAAPCVELGCPCTSDAACAAGADLCALPVCEAGKCATKPKKCDDGNECTTDACDAKTGACATTAVPNCGVKILYSTTFGCQAGDAKSWTLDPSPTGAAAWAIDGTPNDPGYYSADCSLNFNNGKDFACPNNNLPGKLRAFSPVIDASSMVKGAPLTASFRLAGNWENGSYDNLVLSIGTDATATTQLLDLDPPANPWDLVKVDLSSYAGSKFVLTFTFDGTDCISNGGVGAFIDDLKVFDSTCTSDAMCDDDNECTMDSCHKPSGKCIAANLPTDTVCSPTNKCLNVGTCNSSGQCVGKPVECSTAGLGGCEMAACNTKTGTCDTVPKADDISCSDGNPCSQQGTCKGGKCLASKKFDGTLCDSPEACRVAGGCVAGVCSGGTPLKDGSACSDSDPCTEMSTCKGGQCQAGPGSCDDASPCTLDACTLGKGCSHTATSAGAACDDKSPCTTGDYCALGSCIGVNATGPCDDGNLCTKNDACAKGTCNGGIGTSCDDGKACTADVCVAQTGVCVHSNLSGAACSDSNPCTTDLCSAGSCKGTSVVDATSCSDGSPCTALDACMAGKCIGKPANDFGPCDDGSPCSGGDKCSGGKCLGSPSDSVCNDGNPCSADACQIDTTSGGASCTHKAVAEGGTCDDGDICTTGEVCAAGLCKGAISPTCLVIFADSFDCGKNVGWVFTPAADEASFTAGWAIDATAADPGAFSPACSLNFNNGKTFEQVLGGNGMPSVGTARGPVVDVPANAANAQLQFMSWFESESSTSFDKRFVEVLVDGTATAVSLTQLDNSAPQTTWAKITLPMGAFAGKKLQLQFRIDSIDSVSNSGAGWFVDDVQVRWQK